ncbi:hypothetical protein FA13DRAFT_1312268 [Coprinellus micaceus]|uniref:F-box domain-containing protein n=1 Tax=Coprinellus micaceus TaxID=71717 RepID=A0A4Y7ST86_COPMI|nr:hypothetical protein FA13DRAFT_1312268 [Coprinellus micaceus]
MAATNLDYSSFSGASRLLLETSGVTEAEGYHAKIKQRIQELEQETLRISQEICALKSCHNTATTANRLPSEVLALIFSSVSRFNTGASILTVAHICRHWRLIAMDHPQLFADLRGIALQSEAHTRAMVRLSKEAP